MSYPILVVFPKILPQLKIFLINYMKEGVCGVVGLEISSEDGEVGGDDT